MARATPPGCVFFVLIFMFGCAHPKPQQVWRIELKNCATVAEHLVCECRPRQVLNAKSGQYYIECD